MHSTHRIVALALLLLLPVAAGSLAGTTPEAQKWLQKMAERIEQRPFEADYSAEMVTAAMGTPMTINLNGHIVQSDQRHKRMALDVIMAGHEGSMELSALMVADGSMMWTEVTNPMLGGAQVMKIELDKMDQMAAANPTSGLANQWSGMDPVDQIRQLAEKFDFDVAESDPGSVKLSAKMTPQQLSQLGFPEGAASETASFVILIDEGTGFPKQFQLAGEKPLLTMTFDNFKQLDPATIEPGSFSYSPPQGVQVMDLGAMLDAMGSGEAEPE